MAILSSCCCWRSVRRGSFASGFYTLIYYAVLVVGGTFQVESTGGPAHNDTAVAPTSGQAGDERSAPLALTVFVLVCAGMSVLASVVLLVGLCVDNRLMLLPWICSVTTSTLVCFIYSVYLIATMSFEPFLAAIFTLDFFLSLLNVYSLLCVISQYQEYKEGRGRSEDWLFQAPVKYEPWGSCPGDRRKVTFQENGLTTVVGGGALKRKKDNGSLESKTLLTVDDARRRHRPRIHFQEPASSSADTSESQARQPNSGQQRSSDVQFCSSGSSTVVFRDSPSTDTTSSKLPSEVSSLVVLSLVIGDKRVQFSAENELSVSDVASDNLSSPKRIQAVLDDDDQPPAYTTSAVHIVTNEANARSNLVLPTSDSPPLYDDTANITL